MSNHHPSIKSPGVFLSTQSRSQWGFYFRVHYFKFLIIKIVQKAFQQPPLYFLHFCPFVLWVFLFDLEDLGGGGDEVVPGSMQGAGM